MYIYSSGTFNYLDTVQSSRFKLKHLKLPKLCLLEFAMLVYAMLVYSLQY